MNVLVPSAPAGAHGVAGAGDGLASRREAGDGDFAAALAETAGEGGEESKGHEKPADARAEIRHPLRAGRRLDAREAHAQAREKGEAAMPRLADEGTAPEVARKTGLKGARKADAKAEARPAEPDETRALPPAPENPDPAAASAAVREVLSVLGGELTARPERTAAAAGPELAASARKTMAARAGEMGGDGTGLPEGPDLGDETEVEVLPVRVVRRETHFQPGGVEARRWHGAQDAIDAARAMATAASETRNVTTETAPRERGVAPTGLVRTPETAAPIAAPAMAAGDLAPGSVGLQIADRVQQALSPTSETGAPASPPAGAIPEADARQTFAPALRTIKLQLNPVHLGTVTIVLSGNDDGLSIHLAAEVADTVSKVESDRGVLAARLSGAGYAVTELTVARMAGQGMDSDAREQGARQGGAHEPFSGNASREGGAQFAGQHAGRRFGERSPHADMGGGAARSVAGAPVVSGVSYAGRFRPI